MRGERDNPLVVSSPPLPPPFRIFSTPAHLCHLACERLVLEDQPRVRHFLQDAGPDLEHLRREGWMKGMGEQEWKGPEDEGGEG